MGSINLDLTQMGVDSKGDSFINLLCRFYLQPIIGGPTRITSTSATLFKSIFTNMTVAINSGILLSESDLLPVFFSKFLFLHLLQITNRLP